MNFKCGFNREENPDWPCDEDTPVEAAEAFAKYAQVCLNMWEYDNEWDGNHAVVVETVETNERRIFNINRKYCPSFDAEEVKPWW